MHFPRANGAISSQTQAVQARSLYLTSLLFLKLFVSDLLFPAATVTSVTEALTVGHECRFMQQGVLWAEQMNSTLHLQSYIFLLQLLWV